MKKIVFMLAILIGVGIQAGDLKVKGQAPKATSEVKEADDEPKEVTVLRKGYEGKVEIAKKEYLAGLEKLRLSYEKGKNEKGNEIVKNIIDELKPTDETTGLNILSKTGEDQWLSKDSTYELSSNGNTLLDPSFLSCDKKSAYTVHTRTQQETGEYQWVKINLGKIYDITSIEIENRLDTAQNRIVGATLLISTDDKKWNKIGLFKNPDMKFIFKLKGKKAQYVKIQQTTGELINLKSVKIFGN